MNKGFVPCACFLLSLVLLSGVTPVFAQSLESRRTDRESSLSESRRDWLGFQASLSANYVEMPLSSNGAVPQMVLIEPQIGYRVQLGLVLDRHSDGPIVLSVGFCKAQNRDEATKGLLRTTSLLDMGIEFPTWKLLNRRKHDLRFDIGAFASMCSVASLSSKGFHKWGLSGRYSLAYDYELFRGCLVGGRLFYELGKYFGKASAASDLDFSDVNNLGLAVCVTF